MSFISRQTKPHARKQAGGKWPQHLVLHEPSEQILGADPSRDRRRQFDLDEATVVEREAPISLLQTRE